jgi:hypothetical protein
MLPIELTWPYMLTAFCLGGLCIWLFMRILWHFKLREIENRMWQIHGETCKTLGYHAVDGAPQRDYSELPENVIRYLRQN